jgi:ABC-type multidrug transport system fused ATPase/permease subunit
VTGAVYFGILSKQKDWADISPETAALQITGSFVAGSLISVGVFPINELANNFTGVMRIKNYAQDKSLREKPFDKPVPPKEWPAYGVVEAKDVWYKYRPELPYVIKGVSFSIQSCEKVGIVGRTGSGKSTFLLGLLRILEIAEPEGNGSKGKITVAGQDIAGMGLHFLRQRIAVIPQEPFLMDGTIRDNIDPFHEYPDAELIRAIKNVQMFFRLRSLALKTSNNSPIEMKKRTAKGGSLYGSVSSPKATEQKDLLGEEHEEAKMGACILELGVESGGTNFSVGERQLLCIARSIVKKPKVLLMDEATANIDSNTDGLIQEMIHSEFQGTTVITIAHRINTIILYDKIIGLKDGVLVEMDSPLRLMNQEGSLFGSLVKENGDQFEKNMRDLIAAKTATH